MQKIISLELLPKQAANEESYLPFVARKLNVSPKRITYTQLLNRSIDARHGKVKINLRIEVYVDEIPQVQEAQTQILNNVENKEPVIIVGAGPAGLFAGLKLIELGKKPIIIERGKDVKSRRCDIANIHRNDGVNTESNYSFGEGGAGAYSDGKLYTRSKKRGDVKGILNKFYYYGASRDIIIDAHPHIGTNKLPNIIKNMREQILECGGQVLFDTCVNDLIIKNNEIKGVVTQDGQKIEAKAVLLATGHSARDIYFMLDKLKIKLEAKSFAMGVRVEHPQELIDSIQYSCINRGSFLPAAAYSLVHQVNGRGVYSFCMCPGGVVVPASVSPNEMVVNGMSTSTRSGRWANSGIVTEIRVKDIGGDQNENVLKGLEYQMAYEKLAFNNGGEGQIAPAQRMTDFVQAKMSSDLPKSSFKPGLHSSVMNEWIPDHIKSRLQDAFKFFGTKMRGYLTQEATLLGVESRTSSPVRIPREFESLQHPQIKGLYPCGEGAGYAGGIVSSAIDGENCAIKAVEYLNK